jgi:hypothetical protein
LASWHLRQALTGNGTVQNLTFEESITDRGKLHTLG